MWMNYKSKRSNSSDEDTSHSAKCYEYGNDVTDLRSKILAKKFHRSKIHNKSHSVGEDDDDDDDDDDDVSGASTSGSGAHYRFTPYNGRPGRPYGRGRWPGHTQPDASEQLVASKSKWYQVEMPNGGTYSKDYILDLLSYHLDPIKLNPLWYSISGYGASFYIDDFAAANGLFHVDRKITLNSGYKLHVFVSSAPTIQLPDHLKENLKQAMANRYNPRIKALDLSDLGSDPALSDHEIPLQRTAVMGVVMGLVSEDFPELVALNLSDNKLHGSGQLIAVARRVPSLRILHLGRNKICSVQKLEPLKGLRLMELILAGNPLCDKYKKKSEYLSAVRIKLPKVLKLDGVELPPPILFDVQDEEVGIPPAKAHFFCSDNGRSLAQTFLEQYYGIYDSESRLPLADAYHEDAMFSLTAFFPPGQSPSNSQLIMYRGKSRNLMNKVDKKFSEIRLQRGRQSIMAVFNKLPRTEHDIQSFTYDLLIFTPKLMVVAVSGVFRETAPASPLPVLSFSRVMVVALYEVGMGITNDELFITTATPEQVKVAFKPRKPATTPIWSPAGVSEIVTAAPPSALVYPMAPVKQELEAQTQPTGTFVDDPDKTQVVEALYQRRGALVNDAHKAQVVKAAAQQLYPPANYAENAQVVKALAQKTGMNPLWSKKCLDMANWDLQRAFTVFTELYNKGLVPAGAFVK